MQQQRAPKALLSASLARFIFRLYRSLTRFPSFDETKLCQLIDRAEESERTSLQSELEQLKLGQRSHFLYISLLVSILCALKELLIIQRNVTLFNYMNQSANFEFFSDHNNNSLVHFTCMTTNCSRLSGSGSLIDDMSQLPVFVICDPLAWLYFVPYKYLDKEGSLLCAYVAFGVILYGFYVPIRQLMVPRNNNCCTYAQAPQLSILAMTDRMMLLIDKVLQACDIRLSTHKLGPNQSLLEHHKLNQLSDNSLISDFDSFGKSFKTNEIRKLLPIVRSDWFHLRLVKICCVLCLTEVSAATCILFYTISSYLEEPILRKAHLLRDFHLEMRQQGCNIWLTSDESSLVDITSFDLSWNWMAIIECTLIHLMPTFISIIDFIIFYQTIIELICWQSELKNQLHFLVEFNFLSEISYNRKSLQHEVNGRKKRRTALQLADITMGNLQDKFKAANGFSLFVVQSNLIQTRCSSDAGQFSANSRLKSAVAFQDLSLAALKMIRDIDRHDQVVSKDVRILLFKRAYVNLCLYLEHFKGHTSSMASIIGRAYVLLYGIILISVWYCNKFQIDQLSAPVLPIACVWAYTNMILLTSSAVHAKGKSLHGAIWSLVAQLSRTKDVQAKPFMDLWMKQVKFIDSRDGIALEALGLRVTYVRIIQVIIWAATIVVFVPKL